MNNKLKYLFILSMSFALMFGFLHLFLPEGFKYSFERLHIFLFNLVSGGTIILYFTENKHDVSLNTAIFFLLSFSYAILAFLEIYAPAIVIAIILSVLVEIVRIKRFSFFPYDFFDFKVDVSQKFHQASLLCLSIGLFFSSLAIINEQYLKFLSSPKFQLNTFFLGFSFPLSLITFSQIFDNIKKNNEKLKNICFWVINLGVITFFVFILMGSNVLELIISLMLLTAICTVFIMYFSFGIKNQEKAFLISGIIFLIFTALSGIIYIVFYFFPIYIDKKLILRLHAVLSLYGWNLSGLIIVCRKYEFPLKFDFKKIIFLHWLVVFILSPLGYYFKTFSIICLISYMYFLYLIFFSPKKLKVLQGIL